MILENIAALNVAVKLSGDKQLVPFAPVHIEMMDLGPFDRAYLEYLENWPGILDGMARLGHAYTGVLAGKPMCSFGIFLLWPGVAEMWLIPDANLTTVALPFHRATKEFIDICMDELHLVRLQVTVHTLNGPADKWIKRLHFNEEGILRRFGPEGADYRMYAKMKDPDHHVGKTR